MQEARSTSSWAAVWTAVLALLPLLPLLHAPAAAAPLAAQPGPTILIVADMEGVTGVVTSEQLGPTGFEYERFRGFMTDEVLAAMEGARAAGAGRILVADSHGNGQNLLIDRLPEDVRVIRSWPRRLGMLEGVDQDVDGVLFVGFHAATGDLDGVRAHTMSSANLTGLVLNGEPASEARWGAAIAGHFGVPVLMLSGDDAIAASARRFLPDLEVAVVKRALSFHSADTLTPAAGRALIRETAERAVRRIGSIQPFRVDTPVEVTIRFKHYQPSQLLALLPIFERTDSHSVRFRAADMVEASRILEFLGDYRIDLEP